MLHEFSTLTGTSNSKIPAIEIGILFREPIRLKIKTVKVRTLLVSTIIQNIRNDELLEGSAIQPVSCWTSLM
jgi:hypothetical protein